MAYSSDVRAKAFILRRKGHSLTEIMTALTVSKNTVIAWTRDVKISELGLQRRQLQRKRIVRKIREFWRHRHKKEDEYIRRNVKLAIAGRAHFSPLYKIFCALLYWCEGSKRDRSKVAFINSDPQVLRLFLHLFRRSFDIDEKKFRALIHLHGYHNKQKETRFWSKVLEIPEGQFNHPYRKPNAGRRIRNEYHGCVSLRYYDVIVARELQELYRQFAIAILGA